MGTGRGLDEAIRNDLAVELSRRELLHRAGALGIGAAVASALPVAAKVAVPERAGAQVPLLDGTLEAFYDTIIPGRRVEQTELGNPIHPRAIAGVEPDPGAVEADALLLGRNPRIGFIVLEPVLHAELTARALLEGGLFLHLDYGARQRVSARGLAFSNPTRLIWEAAAAVPFSAFCAAMNVREATAETSVGYQLMGHPGTAPRGYRDASYRRRLNRGLTTDGNLP